MAHPIEQVLTQVPLGVFPSLPDSREGKQRSFTGPRSNLAASPSPPASTHRIQLRGSGTSDDDTWSACKEHEREGYDKAQLARSGVGVEKLFQGVSTTEVRRKLLNVRSQQALKIV
jgi:hypothetical protein